MRNAISTEHRGVVRLSRFLTGVLAVTVLAGCTPGSSAAPQAGAGKPAANEFGPDGFGKLKLTMTEQEALATGDLGTSPVAVVTGCNDYSFVGGPSPDPKRMAEDEKIEKRYRDAQQAADKADKKADKKLGPNASAQEYADSTKALADAAAASAKAVEASAASAQRAAERSAQFTTAGGASFGGGKFQVLVAPPQAKTAAGIGRGATVEQLKAAYESQGLKSTSEGRFEMPAPGHPDWSFAFDVAAGKVAYFLLLNNKVRCG